MPRDVRRALGVPHRRRRRIWPAAAAAVAAVTALTAVVVGLTLGTARDGERVPAAEPAGVIDRGLYRGVRTGSSKSLVRRMLGGGPRRVERSPLQQRGPECWVYGRRSGAEGVYRFCFRGDRLESKYLG